MPEKSKLFPWILSKISKLFPWILSKVVYLQRFKWCDMYYKRLVDEYLKEWAHRDDHKPILLRGARQVGKSSAARHLGASFESFVEVNFERQPEYKALFSGNMLVERLIS